MLLLRVRVLFLLFIKIMQEPRQIKQAVSAICEKGNRVIFGKAGGVIQSVRTGRLIPFQREDGIYVLSLWLEEGDEKNESSSSFHRP